MYSIALNVFYSNLKSVYVYKHSATKYNGLQLFGFYFVYNFFSMVDIIYHSGYLLDNHERFSEMNLASNLGLCKVFHQNIKPSNSKNLEFRIYNSLFKIDWCLI